MKSCISELGMVIYCIGLKFFLYKNVARAKKCNLYPMKKNVAIIGGGTAGLFLASFLNTDIYNVSIYEQKSSLGRKFLVAGAGGLNLTHGEEMLGFKCKYTPNGFLDNALSYFGNDSFRAWLLSIGIPTFVGSSHRIFPEMGIKPISVLKAIEVYLKEKGVHFFFHRTFSGWDTDDKILLNGSEGLVADIVVFALGGASWKVTGSDGSWWDLFAARGIDTVAFRPANCAYKVDWERSFVAQYVGKPLKNIRVSIDGSSQKGELVVTDFGIEGNAIYALGPAIRPYLQLGQIPKIYIDFKPMYPLPQLIALLAGSAAKPTDILRQKIKLSKVAIAMIKGALSRVEFLQPHTLAACIKHCPLYLSGAAPIDEAISSAGGISLSAVDSHFRLAALANTYCIGEMLDWEAPTGGYLIQACASMGAYLAAYLNNMP